MGPAPRLSHAGFADAVRKLRARADLPPRRSLSGLVGHVTVDGRPAFLKVTNEAEELTGVRALEEWGGEGAIRVIGRAANAILLESAGPTLGSTVTEDAAVTEALCGVARRLHSHRPADLDGFPTLRQWFSSLLLDSTSTFDTPRAIAARLLDRCGPPVLLHGDLHQENVLDSARGWLAVDPKGIVGNREFDYCSIFTNWTAEDAVSHFDSRLRAVARLARIPRPDLLRWIAAWGALSGIWHLESGKPELAALPHSVMTLALDRLAAL